MLFACDIGNTNISLGLFDGETMVFDSKISSSCEKSVDEYAILISGVFAMYNIEMSLVDGAVISSVVRPLNTVMSHAVEKIMHVKPLLVGPGIKTGLNIKTDIPSQIGADIVANAVAATALEKYPMVIVALGTATTLTSINPNGELYGVLICPGVRSSLNALSAQAADLPYVALDKPKALLGKNTIDSMVNGIVYGNAAMIDGLIERIAEEFSAEELTVIATGGLADIIIPFCRCAAKIQYVPTLTLLGLNRIYRLNNRTKP